MGLSVFIDASGLNKGIAKALEYTKRTPSELVNTCALEVAINAQNTMPFSTIQDIDSELGTMSIPHIGKNGRVLQQFTKSGKNKPGNKTYYSTSMGKKEPEVPLAVLIIAARSNPGSKYNADTGNRWLRAKNPFKGVIRAAGRAAMTALVDGMIKGRHSSIKFLRAGWTQCVQTLRKYSVNRFRKGSATGQPIDGAKQYFGADLGGADPAKSGGTIAVCTIENNIGMEGQNRKSFDRALQLHGAAALQAAVDNEGRRQMDYYLAKSAKEDLYDPVNAAWK